MELLADDAEGVGYLLKDRVADVDAFIDAVRRVADGGSALDPEVVSQLLGRRRARRPARRADPARARGAGADGRGPHEPGDRRALVVSERAVEKHVTSIFSKLGLATSARGPPPRAGRAHLPARLRAAQIAGKATGSSAASASSRSRRSARA